MTLRRRTPLRSTAQLRAKKALKRTPFKPKGVDAIAKLLGEGAIKKASSISKKPRKPMRKRTKGPTGEMKLFILLYHERGGYSEISGIPLLPPEHDWFVRQFSHILPKGTYPEFRLLEDNIVLKTAEEHRQWEEEKWTLHAKQEWQWVFEKEAQLKQLANA